MDTENTPIEEVAPQADVAQSDEVAPTETVATPPETAQDTGEKLYAGKYKSPEDMEKAYVEAQSKMTQLAQEKARLEAAQVTQEFVQPVTSEFDEETTNYVKSIYAQERERERVTEFVTKNQEKLADPVVRGAVKEIIAEHRARGEYIDQNDALRLAESQIETRLSKKITEAKASGEREGLEIATKKEQLAGIGTTAGKSEVDPSSLSAKEFADYFQLKKS
jgi:hypothetical protein